MGSQSMGCKRATSGQGAGSGGPETHWPAAKARALKTGQLWRGPEGTRLARPQAALGVRSSVQPVGRPAPTAQG